MTTTSGTASRITGTGAAFPKKVLTNNEIRENLAKIGVETSDEWIRERTGIRERHISEDGNEKEHNSALCTEAAKHALEMAGKSPSDIDLIVSGTCSPDTLVPSTACWIQARLGAKNAWGFDLNAACSGFVYSLAVADSMIRSGQAKTVLVTGSDVLHPFVNWEDRGTCILFGDAAGAVILEKTSANSENRILSSHLHSDGSLHELFFMPAGGSRQEVTEEVIKNQDHKMQMKGREVFKEATRTLAQYAFKALEANQMTADQVDWFIPHQANMRIIEAVAKRMNFPMEKVLINLDRYGNTSSGTVPTVLDEAVRDGRIQKGQILLMDVFGAGLTYGSILMRW